MAATSFRTDYLAVIHCIVNWNFLFNFYNDFEIIGNFGKGYEEHTCFFPHTKLNYHFKMCFNYQVMAFRLKIKLLCFFERLVLVGDEKFCFLHTKGSKFSGTRWVVRTFILYLSPGDVHLVIEARRNSTDWCVYFVWN